MVVACLPAGLILALDRVTKRFVLGRPRGLACPERWRGPRIRPVHNARLGVGPLRNPPLLVLLWGAAVVGTFLVIAYVPALQAPAAQAGLGAALGGATGNLVDLLRRGAVVDFIDLRVWPVFNVADAAIVLGVAVGLGSGL